MMHKLSFSHTQSTEWTSSSMLCRPRTVVPFDPHRSHRSQMTGVIVLPIVYKLHFCQICHLLGVSYLMGSISGNIMAARLSYKAGKSFIPFISVSDCTHEPGRAATNGRYSIFNFLGNIKYTTNAMTLEVLDICTVCEVFYEVMQQYKQGETRKKTFS